MIAISIKTENHTKRVKDAADRAIFRNLGHAASTIRKDAVESIEPADGASPPGTPPHTHTSGMTKSGKVRRGNLQRAIAYANDKAAQEAVIGPRFSVVGESGAAHELGEPFEGDDYPERPYMLPALEHNEDRFAQSWAGSIGE